jgi:hypothetical protein
MIEFTDKHGRQVAVQARQIGVPNENMTEVLLALLNRWVPASEFIGPPVASRGDYNSSDLGSERSPERQR